MRAAVSRIAAALAGVALLAGCSALEKRPATTPVAIPTSAPTAAPGESVAVRNPVTVTGVGSKHDRSVQVAVLGAFAGDTAYWDSVPNGKDFAGTTPVWLVVQYRWPDIAHPDQLEFSPVVSDGSTAKPLVTRFIGGSPACGIRLEDSRDITPTGMECELIAMQHPKALTAVEYRGIGLSDVIAPDPDQVPYVKKPIRWSVPGGAKPVPAGAESPDD